MANPTTVQEALLRSGIATSMVGMPCTSESYWWVGVGDPDGEQFQEGQFPMNSTGDIGLWMAEKACEMYPDNPFSIAYRRFQAPPFNLSDPIAALVAGI